MFTRTSFRTVAAACLLVIPCGGVHAQTPRPAESVVSTALSLERVTTLQAGGAGVAPFTGAATFEYALDVPSARTGLKPDIRLRYSSDNRDDGAFGVGWSLGLPRIERKRRGLAYADSDVFVFVSDGTASPLVSCAAADCQDATEANEYREKIGNAEERRFFRDGAYWTGVDAAGAKYHFGINRAARREDASGAYVFAWYLERIEDRSGNVIVFEYQRFDDLDSYGRGSPGQGGSNGMIYPKEIRYPLRAERSAAGAVAPLTGSASTTISFELSDAVDDLTLYDMHFPSRRMKLVTGIVVSAFLPAAEARPAGLQPVTKYALKYDGGALTGIRRLGYQEGYQGPAFGTCTAEPVPGETGCVGTPPTTYSYHGLDMHAAARWDTGSVADATWNLVGDFDGDGGADIARPAGSAWAISRFNGTGFTEQSWSTQGYPAYDNPGLGPPLAGDFDGDGATDIAVPSSTGWRVSLSRPPGNFSTSDWSIDPRSYAAAGVADVDGDGRSDIVFATGTPKRWAVARSTGSSFETSLWSADTGTPVIDASTVATLLGDFDGDGRTDVLVGKSAQLLSHGWALYRSTGTSFASATGGLFPTSASYPSAADARWVALDSNGDGLTDLARVRAGRLVNSCGYPETAGCNVDPQYCVYTNGCWRDTAYPNQNCWYSNFPRGADGCYNLSISNIQGWREWNGSSVAIYLSNGAGFIYSESRTNEWSASGNGFLTTVVGDFDGNGTSEVTLGGVYAWFAADPGGRRQLAPFFPLRDEYLGQCVAVSGDFNRTGRADVAVSCPATGQRGWDVTYDPGTYPGLLNATSNGVGASHEVTYASTSSYNRLAPSFGVVNNWMPPKPVLSESVTRAIAPAASPSMPPAVMQAGRTAYVYSNGWMSWLDQEFRGFGSVAVASDGSPTRTTYFLQARPRTSIIPELNGFPAAVWTTDSANPSTVLQKHKYKWDVSRAQTGTLPVVVRPGGGKTESWIGPAGNGQGSSFAPLVWTETTVAYAPLSTTVTKSGTGVPTNTLSSSNIERTGLRGDARRRIRVPNRLVLQDAFTAITLRDTEMTWWPVSSSNDGWEGALHTVTGMSSASSGSTVTYEYNADGTIQSVTSPIGVVTRLSYDADDSAWTADVGRVFPVKSELVGTAGGVRATDLQFDYRFGELAYARDPNGTEFYWTRDEVGRPTGWRAERSGALFAAEHLSYALPTLEDISNPSRRHSFPKVTLTATDPPLREWPPAPDAGPATSTGTSLWMDGLGRAILEVSPLPDGASGISTHYDSMGRLVFRDGPYTIPSTENGYYSPGETAVDRPWMLPFYDAYGRVSTVAAPNSDTSHCYGPVQCTEFASPEWFAGTKLAVSPYGDTLTGGPVGGRQAKVAFDADGSVRVVYEGATTGDPATSYVWDAAKQLTSMTDSKGRKILEGAFDRLGRTLWLADADVGEIVRDATGAVDLSTSKLWRNVFDFSGTRLDYTEDPKGQRRWFSYDEFGRVESICRGDSRAACESEVAYVYDLAENGIGRLYSVSDGRTTRKVLRYDELGRAVSVSFATAGLSGELVTTAWYDCLGRLERLIYPDQFEVSYRYHGGTEFLQRVASTDESVAAEFPFYTTTGSIDQIVFNNGATTKYRYHPGSGILIGLITTAPNGSPDASDDILNVFLTYNKSGDVKGVIDYATGRRLGAEWVEWKYDYDALGRLRSEQGTLPGGALPGDVSRATALTMWPHALRAHAIASIDTSSAAYGLEHDLNGNVRSYYDVANPLSPISVTLDWDAEDRLERVTRTGGPAIGFEYGVGEVRTRKLVGSPPTSSRTYVGPHYELDGSGGAAVATRYVFANGLRIAMSSNGETAYFHKDFRDNTIGLTNEDGDVVWTASYDPYGQIRTEQGSRQTPYLFGDHERDPETGLYYFGARYYDPATGRFLSADSIVPRVFDPQSFNRYAYARNSPLTRIDPDGHSDNTWWCFSWLGCGGGSSGGGANGPVTIPGSGPRDFYPGAPSYSGGGAGKPRDPPPPPGRPRTASDLADSLDDQWLSQVEYRKFVASPTGRAHASIGPLLSDTGPQSMVQFHAALWHVLRFGSGLGLAWNNHTMSTWQKVRTAAPDALMLASIAVPLRSLALRGALADVPILPEFAGGKTVGLMRSSAGEAPLQSGWAGPAQSVPKGTPGFDIVTRTHVEGHAAAVMRQEALDAATLFINNPEVCVSCAKLLPRMLPSNSTLRVVLPNGEVIIFKGVAQ